MTPPPRSASTSPLSARRTASRSAESSIRSFREKRSNQPFLKMRVMAVLLLRGLYITHSVIVQRRRSVRAIAESDYVGASATKLAASGNVVPPTIAWRDKAIQHGNVAGGPADERSVMLCESESSGVRRGASRPRKSRNCVAYWPQSSRKRPSIGCQSPSHAAVYCHTQPFPEVRRRSLQTPTFIPP